MDMERSAKLGEPLGIRGNQIDKGYAIGNFNAEICEGFDDIATSRWAAKEG